MPAEPAEHDLPQPVAAVRGDDRHRRAAGLLLQHLGSRTTHRQATTGPVLLAPPHRTHW
ncbi:hypothetical protein [Saccharothrix algeriensis]|uniref:Uncharacterized protein n=1 Tax=Saccharothrix algeriensis TaxID=173560 RepID=A0ABS2S0E8_9PSEU|nr:hypothetical protein [Saccharothrix algeriensis]MBM7809703.1 hypothetical protein [Saccharothrix algeriensis]